MHEAGEGFHETMRVHRGKGVSSMVAPDDTTVHNKGMCGVDVGIQRYCVSSKDAGVGWQWRQVCDLLFEVKRAADKSVGGTGNGLEVEIHPFAQAKCKASTAADDRAGLPRTFVNFGGHVELREGVLDYEGTFEVGLFRLWNLELELLDEVEDGGLEETHVLSGIS